MQLPFIWLDHRSDDPSAVNKFYLRLFGWTQAEKMPPGMSAFGEKGDKPWAAAVASETLPAGWLPYVRVEDLNAATEKALKLGAKVIKKQTKGPVGTFVVVQDPGGGTIALWHQAGPKSVS